MVEVDTRAEAAKKNDDGKARFDLIPAIPLYKLAQLYTLGGKKYGDWNWLEGMSWSRIFAAMMRHAWHWWLGEMNDATDGQHHLTSVIWCAMTLMVYEREGKGTDDRRFV